VYFGPPGELVDCSIYARTELLAGHMIPGPAVVEEVDSTTVVLPGYCATVDRYGSLVIVRESSGA
jgi:N-methylhydantoinase A